MQRLTKTVLLNSFIIFVLFSCKTTKYNEQNEYLNRTLDATDKESVEYIKNKIKDTNTDSIRARTSDFYDIEIFSKPIKKVFNIEENKYFSMQITNYGTKELYSPEWFRIHNEFNNSEMNIVIYKKNKQKFEKYIQKRMTTQTSVHPAINGPKRIIFNTNGGKKISYEKIMIDKYFKIVDEGSYKVKINIDLSNFGYFEILETEFLFEVKE